MLAKLSVQIAGSICVLMGIMASQNPLHATEIFLLPCGVALIAWAQLKINAVKSQSYL